jgi:hypothetical protein
VFDSQQRERSPPAFVPRGVRKPVRGARMLPRRRSASVESALLVYRVREASLGRIIAGWCGDGGPMRAGGRPSALFRFHNHSIAITDQFAVLRPQIGDQRAWRAALRDEAGRRPGGINAKGAVGSTE